MQTERMTFLTTRQGKASIMARAAAQGISAGEYLRRKVEDDDLTPEQEQELAALVAQLNGALPAMTATLDQMVETVRQTRADLVATIDRLDRLG